MPNKTTQGSNPTAADVRMSARDITEAEAHGSGSFDAIVDKAKAAG